MDISIDSHVHIGHTRPWISESEGKKHSTYRVCMTNRPISCCLSQEVIQLY